MAKLYPYLYSNDAKSQARFYAEAFGGEIVGIQTFADVPGMEDSIQDKVMHLVLQMAGITIFMADSVSEPVHRGNGLDLTMEFKTEDEARTVFQKLSDGGSVIIPFQRMFWGAMFGRVEDRYGVRWQIAVET
jgi:PhnB protein